MFCAIWYHFYNLKNVKNNHGGVLLLLKFQSKNLQLYKKQHSFIGVLTFSKLYKWYQIAQRITCFLLLVVILVANKESGND